MKIKKTIFSTELELAPSELYELVHMNPAKLSAPFFRWLNEKLGFKFISHDESSKKTHS